MNPPAQLTPSEWHHLHAAQGWAGLGCLEDALKELEAIGPHGQLHPQVLQTRWEGCAAGKNWPAALEVAASLIQSAPEEPAGWVNRSYCLHELKRTQEARDNLLRVVGQFENDTTMRYNLACYECQLGRLTQALIWLEKACALGGNRRVRQMAMADP